MLENYFSILLFLIVAFHSLLIANYLDQMNRPRSLMFADIYSFIQFLQQLINHFVGHETAHAFIIN